MIELKRLNVVKLVDDESKAQALESKGFERIERNEDQNPDPATDPLDALEPDELRAYAEEHGIDLGRASSKEGILEKIRAAQN